MPSGQVPRRPHRAGTRAGCVFSPSAYGRAAQREHDNYITVLDNASDLGSYAEAKDIVQPATYETCVAPKPARTTTGRVRHIRATGHGRHRS